MLVGVVDVEVDEMLLGLAADDLCLSQEVVRGISG